MSEDLQILHRLDQIKDVLERIEYTKEDVSSTFFGIYTILMGIAQKDYRMCHVSRRLHQVRNMHGKRIEPDPMFERRVAVGGNSLLRAETGE